MIFPYVKRANTKYTNTKIHKYTITAYDKVPERPNMGYIFEKRIVQGYLLSLAQLYKYKNAKVQKCKRVAACIAARSAAPVATCLYLTGVVGTKDLIN